MSPSEATSRTARRRLVPDLAPDLASVLPDVPVAMALIGLDGRYRAVNQAFCDFAGRDCDELVGAWYLDPVDPAFHRANRLQAARLLAGEIADYQLEERVQRPDGATAWAQSHVSLRREGGEPVGFVVVAVDVTAIRCEREHAVASERRAREEALAETRSRLAVMFGHNPIGQALLTPGGVLLEVNPALCRMLGASAGDLRGQHFSELIHPDDRAASRAGFQSIATGAVGQHEAERRYRRADGTVGWARLRLSAVPGPDGGVSRLVAQVRDVTVERSQREETARLARSLRRSNLALRAALDEARRAESRFRALLDNLPDTTVYLLDDGHRFLEALGPGLAARDIDPGDLAGELLEDVLDTADVAALAPLVDAAVAGRPGRVEHRLTRSGRTQLFDAVPVEAEEGSEVRCLVVARDIEALKRREVALAVAEARWRATVELAPVPMVEVDLTGRVVTANRALAELTGLVPAALQGTLLADLLGPAAPALSGQTGELGPAQGTASWDEGVHAGKDVGDDVGRGAHLRSLTRADGTRRWVRIEQHPLTGPGGERVGAVVQLSDVTAELAQHSRLATVARHAGDAVAVFDPAGPLRYLNPAAGRLLGVDPAKAVGSRLLDHVHPDDQDATVGAWVAALTPDPAVGYRPVRLACRLSGADGRELQVDMNLVADRNDADGLAVVASVRDVTEHAATVATLTYEASHDALTGLANRVGLAGHLADLVERDERFSLLFVDLDDFKAVNDTHGHRAGDRVLVAVAARLRAAVRAGDLVARVGGDEFVLVCRSTLDPDAETALLVGRVRRRLAAPIALGEAPGAGPHVVVGASIGVLAVGDDAGAVSGEEASDRATSGGGPGEDTAPGGTAGPSRRLPAGRAASIDPATLIDAADRAMYHDKRTRSDRGRLRRPDLDTLGRLA